MMNRAYKSKQLRYRKAALSLVQMDCIDDELYSIASECSDLEWAIDDDDTMLDVFDGDTDEINEFRMMVSDLSNNCERLQDAIRDNGVTEHFDDFFAGAWDGTYQLVGFDSFEEDYYSLTRFENELAQSASGKRLMKLTKERLISIAGQCFGVAMAFLDIRHSYDCLKTAFDALRDDRAELLKNVRTLEDAYEKTQKDPHDRKARDEYDNLLRRLPDRLWIE